MRASEISQVDMEERTRQGLFLKRTPLCQRSGESVACRTTMANHIQLPSSSPPSSRNVRKLVSKASKAVMKSHRVSLPKYNLPIRLRPVRLRTISHPLMSCSIPSAVVPTLHVCRHALACSPRIHQRLPLPTAKRQVSPPHLLLHRHGSVLLHLRRRGVRVPHRFSKDPALNTPYSRDARRIWFWRHANLIFTAVVCFFFGGFVSEIVQSMLPVRPLITPRSRSLT
jgi:hypothetical protein